MEKIEAEANHGMVRRANMHIGAMACVGRCWQNSEHVGARMGQK